MLAVVTLHAWRKAYVSQESLLGEMILQEKDIRIVKAVIYWMYFRPYDDGFANDPSVTRSREVFNAEVYALAEEWKIADLKKLAVEKVELDLGDRKPRKDCSDAIEVVYGSTPSNDRTLRDTFSAHAARFHHDLKGDEKFAERLEQVVGFGKDVFQALSGRYGRYVCPSSSCPAVFEWPVDQVGALPKCPFCQFKFYGSYRAQPAPK